MKYILTLLMFMTFNVFADDLFLNEPDRINTPGHVLSVDTKKVCVVGYSSTVRKVSEGLKNQVYRSYGTTKDTCGGPKRCKIDHLIPLSIGGSNDIKNLWPTVYDGKWNAHRKDTVEKKFLKMVCSGQMPIEEAQRRIAFNWKAEYKRYYGEPVN
jgi:hypothetical protein